MNPADSRQTCPTCGRCVAVRMDGALRKHRTSHRRDAAAQCPGGGIDHIAATREADRLEAARQDCVDLGIGHLWDAVICDNTYSGRMVRETLAGLARCIVETQEMAQAHPTSAAS